MSQSVELGDVLEEKGIYVGTVNGTSMFPMLRNKKDTVIIRPLTCLLYTSPSPRD